MNVATFVGHVGRDAILKKTPSGQAVADFSIAVNNGKDADGKERDPMWVKCIVWEARAAALAQYITKGKMIAVSGPVAVEAWSSRKGEAEAAIVITVRELTFCSSPPKESR
jgi:single-strand DNA-binding protein